MTLGSDNGLNCEDKSGLHQEFHLLRSNGISLVYASKKASAMEALHIFMMNF